MRTTLFLFLIIPFLSISCAVIKDTGRPALEQLNSSNYKKLEGVYSNIPIDTTASLNPIWDALWYQVAYFKYDRYRQPNWRSQKIRMQFLTKNKICLELLEDDKVIKNKTIKGKLKNGYFYKRPFFLVVPLRKLPLSSYTSI